MKKGFFKLLIAITTAGYFTSTCADVSVVPAQIHAPPPGTMVTAGYFTLQNHSQQAVTLTAIRCLHPAVLRCELHATEHHGNQTHMQRVELTLAAQESKTLTAGGLHLMLWLNQSLQDNDNIELRLDFDSGQELAFTLPVQGLSHHENH